MPTSSRKLKVSLTLSADLLALVDRDAEALGETRSGVVDAWLRRAATLEAANAIHDATAKYYRSLSPAARDEDAEWAKGTATKAKRVRYDDARRSPRRKRT